MLWVVFNQNGQYVNSYNVGALPYAGSDDFQIFAIFKDLNLENYGNNAGLKLYKPDREQHSVTSLLMDKNEIVFDGTTNADLQNGVKYEGFYFNFEDFANEDETEILDTVGPWRAVITLFNVNDTTLRRVVGSVIFSVGNGNESEESGDVSLDSILNKVYAELGTKLDYSSNHYVKVINTDDIDNYPFDEAYNLGDIILNRHDNTLYKLGSDKSPEPLTLNLEELNINGNLNIDPAGQINVHGFSSIYSEEQGYLDDYISDEIVGYVKENSVIQVNPNLTYAQLLDRYGEQKMLGYTSVIGVQTKQVLFTIKTNSNDSTKCDVTVWDSTGITVYISPKTSHVGDGGQNVVAQYPVNKVIVLTSDQTELTDAQYSIAKEYNSCIVDSGLVYQRSRNNALGQLTPIFDNISVIHHTGISNSGIIDITRDTISIGTNKSITKSSKLFSCYNKNKVDELIANIGSVVTITGTSGTLTASELAQVKKPNCVIINNNLCFFKMHEDQYDITYEWHELYSHNEDIDEIINKTIIINPSTGAWTLSYSSIVPEDATLKTTSLNSSSTDEEYPSAKATWDLAQTVLGVAEGKCNSFILSYSMDIATAKSIGGLSSFNVYNSSTNQWENKKTELLAGDYDNLEIINGNFNSNADSISKTIEGSTSPYGYIICGQNTGAGTVLYLLCAGGKTAGTQHISQFPLRNGDVFMVIETGVPDRWWSTAGINKLETALDQFYTKSQIDSWFTPVTIDEDD